MTQLFYYTEVIKSSHEDEVDIQYKKGYSFDLGSVLMTYPDKEGLAVVLKNNADKLNPVDYQYKVNPQTKMKEPIKITRFEVTSEPIVILLTRKDEIEQFLSATNGPSSL